MGVFERRPKTTFTTTSLRFSGLGFLKNVSVRTSKFAKGCDVKAVLQTIGHMSSGKLTILY